MTLRPLAAAAAAGAVLLTLLATAPAEALPPTSRTVKDATEADKAYDITLVTLRSAPKSTRPAVVLVKHGRKVAPGDAIDVWFDFDGDRVPDLHLSGDSFSEFTVRKAKSFTQDGKDVSSKDSRGSRWPDRRPRSGCSQPASTGWCRSAIAVAVKSSTPGHADSTDDWAPATEKFTKKVLTRSADLSPDRDAVVWGGWPRSTAISATCR